MKWIYYYMTRKHLIFVILLLYIELVLLCFNFNVFVEWIDKEYKYSFILDIKIVLYLWNYWRHVKYQYIHRWTKSVEKFQRVWKQLHALPLSFTDEISDEPKTYRWNHRRPKFNSIFQRVRKKNTLQCH